MKLILVTQQQNQIEELEFDSGYQKSDQTVALDILLEAQQGSLPELSYRYGCRNELCGICTIEINGKPRLACRAKVKDGDRLSALSTLPVIKDLVNDREPVNKIINGKLQIASKTLASEQPMQSEASTSAIDKLNHCNECYACLSDCPLHERNDLSSDNWQAGNPFLFLKIQKQMLDPASDVAAMAHNQQLAEDLGLDACIDCMKCQCHEGIHLPREVIAPLLAGTADAKEASN